jgi:hypothetical protein
MKFECGDLERAFAVPELMHEAREHLRDCAACRREYRLWNEISSVSKELHEEWETPQLWPAIRQKMQAEPPKRNPGWSDWKVWTLVACTAAAFLVLIWLNYAPQRQADQQADNRDFLTEQALQDVERNEEAYRKSIDRLYQLARPELANAASARAVNYRERLMLLDDAISDVRDNLDRNRFNASLQAQLATLYQRKQHALEELVKHEQNN